MVNVVPPSLANAQILNHLKRKLNSSTAYQRRKKTVLKITQPYAKEFIPKMSQEQFPKLISELYNPEALTKTYTELLNECERVFNLISVSSSVVTSNRLYIIFALI